MRWRYPAAAPSFPLGEGEAAAGRASVELTNLALMTEVLDIRVV